MTRSSHHILKEIGTGLPTADPGMVYEAVGEAAAQAEIYARTAAEFAAVGDARGLAYSIRCAAAALQAAASMAEELRPSQRGGRAA